MWQTFTESARKAVFHSQEHAQVSGVAFVSPSHLLLGILDVGDSEVDRMIEGHATVNELRRAICKLVPVGNKWTGDMTLTPEAKRAIDVAYVEARQISSPSLGCSHLFLGIVVTAGDELKEVLSSFGLDADTCRAKLEPVEKVVVPAQRPRVSMPTTHRAAERIALILFASEPLISEWLLQGGVSPESVRSCLEEGISVDARSRNSSLSSSNALSQTQAPATPLSFFAAIASSKETLLYGILVEMGFDFQTPLPSE